MQLKQQRAVICACECNPALGPAGYWSNARHKNTPTVLRSEALAGSQFIQQDSIGPYTGETIV